MTEFERSGEDFLEDAARLVGVPDEYQRLWTPHRMAYISAGPDAHDDDCPFCAAPAMTDEQGLIVYRGDLAYVVLNLFPYNTGHVLVCPYRHVAMYDEVTPQEASEIATLTQQAMRVLRHVSGNEGFNIGMNQGKVAGAGEPVICTNMSFLVGQQIRTFCPSLRKQKLCHDCLVT